MSETLMFDQCRFWFFIVFFSLVPPWIVLDFSLLSCWQDGVPREGRYDTCILVLPEVPESISEDRSAPLVIASRWIKPYGVHTNTSAHSCIVLGEHSEAMQRDFPSISSGMIVTWKKKNKENRKIEKDIIEIILRK
ncbi:hypothetical protein NQ315_002976 [Exocentrus adspersus]|uniref:Uncharacterized protein n=1 Tax=Exocentrus adspersus TaxID=1586481 RepID=A0AAV8W3Y5_9CUCU|nr:hypothetical protein NQ315_002976 [Exocentrus adspersus]